MNTHDTQWTARAACASRLDLPWTLDAAAVTPWQAATMRAVCGDCPVLFDCLAAVDDLAVTGGWWAGADRDPHADLSHLNPPAWAVPGDLGQRVPSTASAAPKVDWEPVTVGRTGRARRVVAFQACLPLGGVA